MVDPELVAMLVCPATHQDVAIATPEEIARVNEAIRLGEVKTVKGDAVSEPIEGALIRQDRTIAYPIRDGIPVMLSAEGLQLPPFHPAGHESRV